MNKNKVRTRYAPSPTGFVHIGNLRSALYEYLVAKAMGGQFILRIEDTDRNRYVEGAVELIFETLKTVGIQHDEGPDIGGPYAPYTQSERLDTYGKYAQQLIDSKKAYRCFCDTERLDQLKAIAEQEKVQYKYDRHCLALSPEEIQEKLDNNEPYVIRQFIEQVGFTEFEDEVFGKIKFDNDVLEDQILIKSDGYPTYNFANVIDDHLMNITHIVRGNEYITSTPKYIHLYEAFNWDIPTFVHLPLVVKHGGEKLSKRSGDAYFSDFIDKGYLPEALVNYIVLLGWSSRTEEEFFTLKELEKIFDIKGITKSPSTFDTDKLNWMNSEYIRRKSPEEFLQVASKWIDLGLKKDLDKLKICNMIQKRVAVLNEIPDMVAFLDEVKEIDLELYVNKKSKSTVENAKTILPLVYERISLLDDFSHENIYGLFVEIAKELELKNGTVMWPIRVALSGLLVTPGGAVEIADIIGKEETLVRLKKAIDQLENDNV